MDLTSLYEKFDSVADPAVPEESLGAYIENNCDAAEAAEIEEYLWADPYMESLAADVEQAEMDYAEEIDFYGAEDGIPDLDSLELPEIPDELLPAEALQYAEDAVLMDYDDDSFEIGLLEEDFGLEDSLNFPDDSDSDFDNSGYTGLDDTDPLNDSGMTDMGFETETGFDFID